jgi:hypothetical protein
MNAQSAVLEAATIRQQCQVLHLPTVAAQCAPLAEQALRERRTRLGYLEALLQTELGNVNTGWWSGAYMKHICHG